MATNKEITATEKLLDMIRREEHPGPAFGTPERVLAPESGQNETEPLHTLTLEGQAPDSAPEPPLALAMARAAAEPGLPREIAPHQADPPPIAGRSADPSGLNLSLESAPPAETDPEGAESDSRLFATLAPPPAAESNATSGLLHHSLLTRLKRQLPKMPRRATITIGVELDPEYIALVKMNTAISPATLLEYRVVPLALSEEEKNNEDLLLAPGLQPSLQAALGEFCRGEKNHALWTTLSPDHVTVANVTIPKVEAAAIPNAVFWTVQKELKFDQPTTIFDFSILEGVGTDPKKLTAIVFLAKRQAIARLEELFAAVGFPLAGITVSAIAIQNLIQTGWVEAQEGTAAHLYFGEQKSYIDLYSHGQLLFGREIHTGINSFVESVLERASDNFLILDETAAKSCVFTSPDSSDAPGAPASGNGDNGVVNMQELPATRRLIRQLERTFAYCATHYGIKNIKGIFTSGVAQLNQTIFAEINAELGMNCAIINPFAAAKFIDQAAIDQAPNSTDQPHLLAAFGLALSDNRRTQNFLHTTADKSREAKVQALNKIIIGVFLALSLLSLATFSWHRQVVKGKELALDKLRATLEEQYQLTKGSADPTYATGLAGKIQGRYRDNLATAKRFYPLALLHEVVQAIPAPLQLTKLNFSTLAKVGKENRGTEKEKSSESEEESINQISLEGLIPAPAGQLDFILVGFRQRIDTLPLLAASSLEEKKNVTKAGQEIMQFTLRMETKRWDAPPTPTEKEK